VVLQPFGYGNHFLSPILTPTLCDFNCNNKMAGWNVDLKVLLEDCNSYKNYGFQCSTSFSAVSSQEATAGSAMMISGAALLGAAALVIFVSRKRRSAVLDLNVDQQSGFEMMNDSGVRA
jgi:hypothetical protein